MFGAYVIVHKKRRAGPRVYESQHKDLYLAFQIKTFFLSFFSFFHLSLLHLKRLSISLQK